MRRILAALAWTLAGLAACDGVLVIRDRAERHANSRMRRLVPPALLQGKGLAAIRLEDTARGEAILYARSSGGWRCLSRAGAPADEARLNALVERLLDAEGLLQREDAGQPDRFGLDPPLLLRVSLHGPRVLKDRGHDLIALVDVGATLPGGNGTYARLGTSREVIAVDVDLREDLAWPKSAGLAPLQDPHIVPAAWSASAGVERIEVQPQGGVPFELRRRPRPARSEDLLLGTPPWDWVLVAGGREVAAPPGLSTAYARFLESATYDVALDPRLADTVGLARPRARVVLHGGEGQAIEIQLGGPSPAGGVAVRNTLTHSVLGVGAEVAALLVPRVDAFGRGAETNPWEAWLLRGRQP